MTTVEDLDVGERGIDAERDATLLWLLGAGRTPFRVVTDLLGSKHKMSIVWELARSPRRFKELERLLAPVTPKVLTRNLRDLESASLVARESTDGPILRVSYRLTPLGFELRPHVQALCRWAYEHAGELSAHLDAAPSAATPTSPNAAPSAQA
jgi:DNA-binding HxlR family transcriptional regulator